MRKQLLQSSILRKYAEARLPCYTSYPSSPHFLPSVDADIYTSWLSNIPHSEPASLYLHVPFCRSMC